jgi:hypothetical protein
MPDLHGGDPSATSTRSFQCRPDRRQVFYRLGPTPARPVVECDLAAHFYRSVTIHDVQ